jgi:hypothetical protein
MIYWAMLEQGDWDTLRPLFRWMRGTLPLAIARTKAYAKGDPAEFGNASGAFWPETQWIFGTYEPVDYCLKFGSQLHGTAGMGYCAPPATTGHVGSKYARAYWTNGPELAVMMLRYFEYTQDFQFARDEMLPIADAVLEFWYSYFPIVDGKLFLKNDRCDEAVVCNNSVTDVAALTSLVHGLRVLPPSIVSAVRDQQLAQMQAQLPALPTNANRTRLVPGDGPCHFVESTTPNTDNGFQELFTVWPMELTGINRSHPLLPIDIALETSRAITPAGAGVAGGVYPAGAAVLGLADDAAKLLRPFFATHNTTYHEMKKCCCGVYGQPSLFPAFWSSGDGSPCAERGAMVRVGVSKMLIQSEGRRILLLPAWPRQWSCSFRLKAPFQTTVTGRVENGSLTRLSVDPPERRRDVTIVSGQPLPPLNHLPREEDALKSARRLTQKSDDSVVLVLEVSVPTRMPLLAALVCSMLLFDANGIFLPCSIFDCRPKTSQ